VRLENGENKVRDFLANLRLEVLRWPEVAAAGFHPQLFANMNTPEDYAEAVRRAEA
jgi:molybdopterin-guanine dinucleotide biosynthesis protein A